MLKFNTLELYYQNCRGLRTKTHSVYRKIACQNFDVVIFSATWLNNTFKGIELFDNRYIVYRRDRENSS